LAFCFAALGPAVALAAGVPLEQATEEQKAAAKEKYKAGTAAFDARKYEDALKFFQESYNLVSSPNSHLLVARAMARVGRRVDAYNEYRAVVAEAEAAAQASDKYQQTLQAARNELEEVKAQVGFVTVAPGGTVLVAGRAIAPSDWGTPYPVEPGTVEVVWTTPSGAEVRQQVSVVAGKPTEIALEPPASGAAAAPVPEPTGPVRAEPSGINQKTLALVTAAIGVVGVAAFAVFGTLNNSKFDDLESQCVDGACPSNLREDSETGRRYQWYANVGLGVGIAGIATGALLFLTAPSSSGPGERAAALSTPAALPVPIRVVTVSGRF
jgi:hypothetical protein